MNMACGCLPTGAALIGIVGFRNAEALAALEKAVLRREPRETEVNDHRCSVERLDSTFARTVGEAVCSGFSLRKIEASHSSLYADIIADSSCLRKRCPRPLLAAPTIVVKIQQ